MKLVISALHFAWRDMNECLTRATRELGLDGVELSWHDSRARPHCTAEDMEFLASHRGGPPPLLSAHIWDNLAEAAPTEAADGLLNWLRLCDRTGVRNLVIHGGSYADQKEGIARTRRVLERVLPAFERKSVVLNLENHYAYTYRNSRELFSEPWEFLQVLTLDSPSLKCCFDAGHGNMTGNTAELLDALAPRLGCVHLADNHGRDDDHTEYGKGTVAWGAVFTHLQKICFDGVFCVEFPVFEDIAPFHACVEEIRNRWRTCPSAS